MKGRKTVSLLLVLTLIITVLPVQIFANGKVGVGAPISQELETQETTPSAIQIVPSKYIGDDYEVEFKVNSKESDTFSGEIILTNTGDYDLEDWELEFNFQHDIINLKNAILVNQHENSYIIKGVNKISTILQEEQIVICFDATYDTEIMQPEYYILDENIDLENYPKDEEAYRIWKEKIIKKLERKQIKDAQNRMSLFTSRTISGPKSGSKENEYIKFYYSNGTYGLETTGGNPDNPNDNYKRLIFGTGGTSYTTIRINGMDYQFSPDTVIENDHKIIGTKRYGDINVSQHISIIPNQYTNRDDVVEFFYTVENTSDTPHDVGVRVMFDTMLGNNDHAPFRLPTIGDVTTETNLSGDEIPEFWQAFDSLENPSVIAQGTLKLDQSSTPDRVRFTNWSMAHSNRWDYPMSPGSNNYDSAVCLYWNERSVGKDDVFSCKTFYGLSALQQDLRPPLAVALSGATKLEVIKGDDGTEAYSPNPFTVTAYIQNIGTGAAENTNVTLNLPTGMEVLGGNKTVSLGDIPVGTKQHQVSWKVKVMPSTVEKVEKYSVTVTANNTGSKTLEREITIPKIQCDMDFEVEFECVQDSEYIIRMKSNAEVKKALVQFKNASGNWITLDDLKKGERFTMAYVGVRDGTFKYQKTINLTLAGIREFRVLILDEHGNVIKESESLEIDNRVLFEFKVDEAKHRITIKRNSDSIRKFKITIDNKDEILQVNNMPISQPMEYSIEPREYKAGNYKAMIRAYDVNGKLLDSVETGNIKIINPFNIKNIVPSVVDVLDPNVKFIKVFGTGFTSTTKVQIIDSNEMAQVVVPSTINDGYIEIPIKDCNALKSVKGNKNITVRIVDGGKNHDTSIQVLYQKEASDKLVEALARAEWLRSSYKWEAQKRLAGWKDQYYFEPGGKYTIPYGQPVGNGGKFVLYGISLDQFTNETKNSNSNFYKAGYKGYKGAGSPRYSLDCSTFVCHVLGLSGRHATGGIQGLANSKQSGLYNVKKGWDDLRVGDVLNKSGAHVVFVKEVKKENGKVIGADVYEQTTITSKKAGTVLTYYSRAKNSSYKVLGFESFNPENSRSK